MTTPIAADRFRFRVELLPGETVLWEGGAARACVWPRLIAVAALVIGFATFMSLPAVLGWVVATSPESTSVTAAAPDAPAATSAKPRRVPMTPAERAEQRSDSIRHFVIVFGLLVPTILACVHIATRMRQRNAWYVVTSERVCIQDGALTLRLSTIDLDRIVSVQASATWLERRFGVETIELGHAGVNVMSSSQRVLGTSTFAIAGVARGSHVLTHLLGEWLPRDGRRRNPAREM